MNKKDKNIKIAPKIHHKCIVAKDNDLIEQMSKFSLSEHRLIAFCLAHYNSLEGHNFTFRARVADLVKIYPSMHSNYAYAVVRKTMLALGGKPLEVKDPDGKADYHNWFRGFSYDPKKGEFEFRITPDLQPFLLALKDNLTYYRLKDVYQFKAASTWKMYEIFRKNAGLKRYTVLVSDLRQLLNLKSKYPRWNSLRLYIEKAIAEINEVSDLSVDFLLHKRGRAIHKIEFIIIEKQADVIEIKSEAQGLYAALVQTGLHTKTATKYAALAENENKIAQVLKALPKIIKRANKSKVPNAQYVTAAVNSEILQTVLPMQKKQETQANEPAHKKSLDCWMKKGKNCEIRRRKKAKQKRCKQCFVDLPLEDFPEKN